MEASWLCPIRQPDLAINDICYRTQQHKAPISLPENLKPNPKDLIRQSKEGTAQDWYILIPTQRLNTCTGCYCLQAYGLLIFLSGLRTCNWWLAMKPSITINFKLLHHENACGNFIIYHPKSNQVFFEHEQLIP